MSKKELKPWRVTQHGDTVKRTAKDAHKAIHDSHDYFDTEADAWLHVIARRERELAATKARIPAIYRALAKADKRLKACSPTPSVAPKSNGARA